MKIVYAIALIAGIGIFAGCGQQGSGDDLKDLEEEMTSGTGSDSSMETGQPTDPRAGAYKEDSGNDQITDTYTLVEVAQHNTPEDCWAVVDGDVADVTSFFGAHPGGDDKLAQACGKDATALFQSIAKHDPNGYVKFKTLTIGTLSGTQ